MLPILYRNGLVLALRGTACVAGFIAGASMPLAAEQRTLSVLPHALIELTALFLPLAAWLIASRRGEWNQLLAATAVTVVIAIPMLLVAATIEVFVWPHILHSLSGYHYSLVEWVER
jgi:uncharacterized membrane protein SpoIIM required for sporulation